MSSRRDPSTHTTGAHRAQSGRRTKRKQRSSQTPQPSAADGTAWAASSPALVPAQAGAVGGGLTAPRPRPPVVKRTLGAENDRTGRSGRTGKEDGDGGRSGRTGKAGKSPRNTRRAGPSGSAGTSPQDADGPQPPGMARYEPYLDGLFTYCLSVMCEHDAAIGAVGEALVLAERQHERRRAPTRRALHRPWLYALTRWVCLRRLAAQSKSAREGRSDPLAATAVHLTETARDQRRRDLAALAWPEAAGTTPEQREALELAVRHKLPASEVAAVLALTAEAASALLSRAACEVERTRAALAVVKSGGCRVVSGLAGEDQLLLGPAFRRELVNHIDECAHCRRAAERAMSDVAWPGTAPAGHGVLAVIEAPRTAVESAVLAVRRARCRHLPRFDKTGFPVEAKDRVARRERLRSRAVTTTVVATVVAAPVLALWAAYRGAPLTGEPEGPSVSAPDGQDRRESADPRGRPHEDVAQGRPSAHNRSRGSLDSGRRHGRPSAGRAHADSGRSERDTGGRGTGTSRLAVHARTFGDTTLIRLSASGSSPVRWSLTDDVTWLAYSRTGGVLRPGESTTVRVTVMHGREPDGRWAAHLRVGPYGTAVTVHGRGPAPAPPDPKPTPPEDEDPTPPSPPSEDPTSPPPSEPDPTTSSPSQSPAPDGPGEPFA